MLILTLRNGLKFRTLEKDNKVRAEIIESYNEVPTHVTIRNWTLKVGYYELTRPKEKADDWIILLDHSIQFGPEKIFVVLGIREKNFLKLKRPLQYSDLDTLYEEPMKKSNGDLIFSRVEKLQKKLGNIKYAVGDYGSDLKKGLLLIGIIHIHDLSHSISNEIEKIYKSNETYHSFKKQLSLMRSKLSQTNIAAISPPKRRKKSEYQSFDKIVKWADSSLGLLKKLNSSEKNKKLKELKKRLGKELSKNILDKIRENLAWITDYQELINELTEINRAVKLIEKHIKHSGLSTVTLCKSTILLDELTTKTGILFKNNLKAKLKSQYDLLSKTDTILCSSDILESTFGKYKNRVSGNLMASVTVLILMIAAYSSNLTESDIKESMENVKISDIKEWEKNKIGISTHKLRNILLSG